jgi:arylsulfatase A-like enzyme
MAGQDFGSENKPADRAPLKPVFLLHPPKKSRLMIRLLRSGLILFAGFLAFFSCSRGSHPLALKGDLVRLLDVFPQFIIAQTPLAQTSTADISKDKAPGVFEEDSFRESINRDFVKGSPVHPLKLKFTKNPGNGSPLGRQTRNVILASPPTDLQLSVHLKREYVLRFEFAVIGEGWDHAEEEITFSILAEDLKSRGVEGVFTTTLRPGIDPRYRRWLNGRVDLSAYRGKSVKLEFKTTLSDPSVAGRAAAWANPVLAAKDAVPRRPNIILISADTLRADHLGCYGYPRETTPAINRLADRSSRFERAIAQAPYTVSSHMSMLTSLYPSFHKVNKIKLDRLDSEILTLAEALYNSGYRTWAVTGGGQVSSNYGFSEGFESYLEFTSPEDDVKIKVAETIEFLDENPESPVFVFFHTYKPHPPYRPLPPYDTMFDPEYTGNISGDIPTIDAINSGEITATAADLDHLISLYDGDIREMDDQLDELFAYLQRKGTGNDTAIVFTSDHGEEFGEHGLYGVHSHTLYEELVRVPLIIHIPGMDRAGVSIPEQVRSIDIYPTLLELAGVKPPNAIQGRSLLSLIRKGKQSSKLEPAFSERIPADSPWIRSLRTSDYSYMFKEDRENGTNVHLFFDLRRDPREQNSLRLAGFRIRTFFDQILFLVEEGKKPGKAWGEQELDAETLEILRSLGYIK